MYGLTHRGEGTAQRCLGEWGISPIEGYLPPTFPVPILPGQGCCPSLSSGTTATALAYFGLAGEKASAGSRAPGSFQIALLDALFTIDAEQLEEGAKISIQAE